MFLAGGLGRGDDLSLGQAQFVAPALDVQPGQPAFTPAGQGAGSRPSASSSSRTLRKSPRACAPPPLLVYLGFSPTRVSVRIPDTAFGKIRTWLGRKIGDGFGHPVSEIRVRQASSCSPAQPSAMPSRFLRRVAVPVSDFRTRPTATGCEARLEPQMAVALARIIQPRHLRMYEAHGLKQGQVIVQRRDRHLAVLANRSCEGKQPKSGLNRSQRNQSTILVVGFQPALLDGPVGGLVAHGAGLRGQGACAW